MGERAGHGAAGNGDTERLLNEADSLALGERFGVRCAPYRLCRTPQEAVQALRELEGPVAVKGCSGEIAHKSELGIVRLGINTENDLHAAFGDIERRIAEADARFDGVIVAKMFKGQHEFLIGAHIDPVFGPVVLLGDGGKDVEALPDTQLLLPPFNADDVRLALSRLRIAPLFGGVRGEPPMDIPAIVNAVLAVGEMMLSSDANVVSADFNPVIVGAAGQGCAAVDALINVRDGQSSRA
jgi:succinyl-CoA synthetase beta subunit